MNKLKNGQMIEWEDLDKRRYYVIGPSLFMFVRAFIYPFNLIKTRLFMQQQSTVYNGTFDAFRKVLKHEGIRGLYKGFMVSTVGMVSGQLYISTYEIVRSRLHGYSTEMKGLIGGAGATLVAQSVTVPVDIVTQTMMMQGQVVKPPKAKGGRESYILVKNCDYIIPKRKKALKSAWFVTSEILRTEGIRGLYRGYSVSLMTYAPNSALWWMSYGGMFRKAVEMGFTETLPIPAVQACCGVCSGLLAATLTNPLDVIRTRYQVRCVEFA